MAKQVLVAIRNPRTNKHVNPKRGGGGIADKYNDVFVGGRKGGCEYDSEWRGPSEVGEKQQ